MSWKALIAFVIALAIGGGIVYVGARGLSTSSASCGGQTMSPGDVCRTTSNGTTAERSADEQKGQNQQGNYIGIGFGSLIVLGSIFFYTAGARNKRRQQTAARPGPADASPAG
jgi:hypothetical protein